MILRVGVFEIFIHYANTTVPPATNLFFFPRFYLSRRSLTQPRHRHCRCNSSILFARKRHVFTCFSLFFFFSLFFYAPKTRVPLLTNFSPLDSVERTNFNCRAWLEFHWLLEFDSRAAWATTSLRSVRAQQHGGVPRLPPLEFNFCPLWIVVAFAHGLFHIACSKILTVFREWEYVRKYVFEFRVRARVFCLTRWIAEVARRYTNWFCRVVSKFSGE